MSSFLSRMIADYGIKDSGDCLCDVFSSGESINKKSSRKTGKHIGNAFVL